MTESTSEHLLSELLALPAARRASRIRAEPDVCRAVLSLCDHVGQEAMGDLAGAGESARALIALADELDETRLRARARITRAHALTYAGEFAAALELGAEARELAREANDDETEARAWLTSVQALARTGRLQEALNAAEAAREGFSKAGEGAWEAKANVNLGIVRRMVDDPAGALECFDRAGVALADDPVARAQIENNRAEALLELSRFSEAQHAFESAMSAFASAGLSRASAIAEGNLADLLARGGQLDSALRHFEHALREFEENAPAADVARLRAEHADALAAIGLAEEAARAYREALEDLDSNQLVAEAARARVGLGHVLSRSDRLEEAHRVLNQASAYFENHNHYTGQAQTKLVLARVLARLGDNDAASGVLIEAQDLAEDRPLERALIQVAQAALEVQRGNATAAEALLHTAFESADALGLTPLRVDLFHLRAAVHIQRGEFEAGLTDLRSAIAEVERLRGSFQADRLRSAFLGDRMLLFEDTIDLAVRIGGPEGERLAFDLIERAKARSLLDLIAGGVELSEQSIASISDTPNSALMSRLVHERAELNAMYSRVADPIGGDDGGADQWAKLRRLRELEARTATLESRIAATRSGMSALSTPARLHEVREAIGDEVTLVHYFVVHGEIVASVARGSEAVEMIRLAPVEAVTEASARVAFQIERSVVTAVARPQRLARLCKPTRDALAEMYRLIMLPLEDAIGGAKRIVVMPHHPIHAVPFHALWTGDDYLLERVEIAVSPNASLLRRSESRERGPQSPALLLAGYADDAAPQIEAEIDQLAALRPDATVLLGPGATIEAICEQIAANGATHLACHGMYSRGSPLSARLRLADGWLSARDVYGLRIPGGILILSGCETGAGELRDGNEVFGLIRSFLAAGASAVVASLWSVNDEWTREFMTRLYGTWIANGFPRSDRLAESLRTAQLETLARNEHPVLWAPFMLVGSP